MGAITDYAIKRRKRSLEFRLKTKNRAEIERLIFELINRIYNLDGGA